MPILNYTTKIDVAKTMGEIQAALARRVMSMPWANRNGLREAIPPVYTEYLGRQLMAAVQPDGGA